MIVAQQVDEGAAVVNVEDVSTTGVAAEGAASAADDEVPAFDIEPSIPSPILPTLPPQPSQDQPSTFQRVKKLEMRNKVSKLRRLKKVGTTQRIETSDDTVMDDVSKQGRIIVDIDADKDVTLKDVVVVAKDVQNAEIEESSDVQGRQAESQAQIYQIDLELTAASATITVVVPELSTAAAPTLTTAPSAARRRKEVVIRDPEETATPSIIIHTEPKSKDNGKGIMVEEPKPLKKQAQIEQDEAYAREKNMMIYLKNVAGFKIDYFKGVTYDDIRLIFEKKFNSNVVFLQKTKEHMEEEDSKALKRLMPNDDDDDVYTEATPLALKVPVVDYEIYTENNKPYYKIKRADSSHQLYISFLSMLRNFNREDLDVLWNLVKEIFAFTKPKNFSDDFMLTTLGAMFEKPVIQAQI
nr:hypothetical protein [Tanacetum cinerariifolium]